MSDGFGKEEELAKWAERLAEELEPAPSAETNVRKGTLRRIAGTIRRLCEELKAARTALTTVTVPVPDPEVIRFRERLPDERQSITRRFEVRHEENPLKIYLTVGQYPDGRVGELFLKCDKQGSLTSGAFDAVALAVSIGLQYGVPLEAYVSKFIGMKFEPAGFTGNSQYPIATSVLDLVARWMKDKFLSSSDQSDSEGKAS